MTADVRTSVVLASDLLLPLAAVGARAEGAGVHRIWQTEFQGRDAFVRSLTTGLATSTLQLGTGIAYAFTRKTRALAAIALDVQELTSGRFTLGLGAGTRGLRAAYAATDFDPPAPRLAAVVEELRTTWGEAEWTRSTPPPPIAIGGVNEVMLRFAAQHGDRVVFHPLCIVEQHLHSRVLPAIEAGRARRTAGADVRLSAWCIASVDDDPELARMRARRQLVFYLATPGYRGVIDGTGWEDDVARLRDQFKADVDADTLAELVPDELLDQVSIYGRPEQVRAGLAARRTQLSAYGIDELVLQTVQAGDAELDTILALIDICGAPPVDTTPPRLRPRPAWSHTDGIVAVRANPSPGLEVRGLLADRMSRYCWGFDERQEHVLRECFTPDAVWLGNVMGETRIGPHEGRDAVLTYLTRFWRHQRDQRRHVLTNFVVESIDGDNARCLAYLMLVGSTRAATRLEAAGIYCLDYRREADGNWRIVRLSAGFDVPFWTTEVEEMEPWVRNLLGITHHDRQLPGVDEPGGP